MKNNIFTLRNKEIPKEDPDNDSTLVNKELSTIKA